MIEHNYLHNSKKIFKQYQSIGERAMTQVTDDTRLFWTFYNDSNSIAMLVQHLSGNMLSRFTQFFEEDGEKSWRNRDLEFEVRLTSRDQMMEEWKKGWDCLYAVIDHLKEEDLQKTVYIRGEAHTVLEAINRQIAHYAYHIGQIVYLSKMLAIDHWDSLSIPKRKSE
jgi:hypothetical protein